jgi:2-polyprenyl-6-methoxyphenol hydroxylase-like FAD-dependent oxidoreductase
MSPVGGVGINLAIQDAVAAANILAGPMARRALDDAEPERRGINSIQLFKDTDRGWRIIAMIWDNEREGLALPDFA